MKLILNKKNLKNLSAKTLELKQTAIPAGGAYVATAQDICYTDYAGCQPSPSNPIICWSGTQTK